MKNVNILLPDGSRMSQKRYTQLTLSINHQEVAQRSFSQREPLRLPKGEYGRRQLDSGHASCERLAL